MTPDPYQGTSGGPGDANNPQSWNRYAYVAGDPVNRLDPNGLDYELICGDDCDQPGADLQGINQGFEDPTGYCDPSQRDCSSQTCPFGTVIASGTCVSFPVPVAGAGGSAPSGFQNGQNGNNPPTSTCYPPNVLVGSACLTPVQYQQRKTCQGLEAAAECLK